MGTGTNVYLENGSEQFYIKNVLNKQLEKISAPVIFDVGANIGLYTLALKESLPFANVYSFEPVKQTFDQLKKNAGRYASIYNVGFGDAIGKGLLYNGVDDTVSEIATTHKAILADIFKATSEIKAIEFEIDTIDNFCSTNNIEGIDFLKLDVEGNELAILKGASDMLANNRIKIIQFEFNTHNVYAKVFLHDFYQLLAEFEFYRLKQNGVVNLGKYNPVNEIFTAQNIVAVHESVPNSAINLYLIQIGAIKVTPNLPNPRSQ